MIFPEPVIDWQKSHGNLIYWKKVERNLLLESKFDVVGKICGSSLANSNMFVLQISSPQMVFEEGAFCMVKTRNTLDVGGRKLSLTSTKKANLVLLIN